jgi:hypothetical protein
MAGYLDQYGAGEERRGKLIRYTLLSILIVAVVGGGLSFYLWDFRQERQVKRFFELIRAGDYKAGHALWGCTDQTPCRDYSLERFLEDWGPKSKYAGFREMRIERSRSCSQGVIVTAIIDGNREERFMVDRATLIMGFSPWPVCPR